MARFRDLDYHRMIINRFFPPDPQGFMGIHPCISEILTDVLRGKTSSVDLTFVTTVIRTPPHTVVLRFCSREAQEYTCL